MTFFQWERHIMVTLVIYLEFFRTLSQYHKRYAYKRRDYHYGQLVKIVDDSGNVAQDWWMKYIPVMDRWIHYDNWYQNEYRW